MAAMQTEGAVRAHGRTGNLLDWLPSPLDEENSLVSNGVASIHISQEQGEKKKGWRRKRGTAECNKQINQSEIQYTCVSNLLVFKIYFKGEVGGSKPHASLKWNLFHIYIFSKYLYETNWQRCWDLLQTSIKMSHSYWFMVRLCHVQGAVSKEAETEDR